MADNTPVTDPVTSAPTAETQLEATTKEVEIPTFAKSLEQNEEVKVEDSKPQATEAPVPEEEDAILKKRLSGAISEVEKRNEEARRFVELQTDQVRENNELIHKVAATDPLLANKVVQKVWGVQGIKSYKQLLERSKLEELKTVNPEAYETKKALLDVQSKLASVAEKEQKIVRNKFLSDKGILENEYDPNYRKLMSALDNVNPTLISEDYDKALKIAYASEFSEARPIQKAIEMPSLQVGGGKQPAPLPSTQPKLSDQSSWLAQNLNKRFGYNIPL